MGLGNTVGMKSFLYKTLHDTIHSQLHVHVDYLNITAYRQLW